MNLASEEGDPSSGIIFANFNQSATGLQVGTKNGYQIYDLDGHRFKPLYKSATKKDICIVERLYYTSLVVIVELSSPRKLAFYNFETNSDITYYHFANTILSVKLNRTICVVCLEDSLHIHINLKKKEDNRKTHVIKNTPPNPQGLFALTTCNSDSLLAYPGSSIVGDIEIFNASKLYSKITIPAHNNPLAALAFSYDGSKIASASEKGTVIRVFNVSNGQTLFEFRRGVKRCVTIYSLSFSANSEFLCASSNTETVHIFKLCKDESSVDITGEPQGWMGTFSQVLTNSMKYLPTQMSEVLTQQRSFATIYLPFSGLKNVCCIAMIDKLPHVLVASADGFLYIYHLNTEGGPCSLVKQYRIDGSMKFPEISLMSSCEVAATSDEICAELQTPSKSNPESRPSNSNVGALPLHLEVDAPDEQIKEEEKSNTNLPFNNGSLLLFKEECLTSSVGEQIKEEKKSNTNLPFNNGSLQLLKQACLTSSVDEQIKEENKSNTNLPFNNGSLMLLKEECLTSRVES